jgi:hypothetical protein
MEIYSKCGFRCDICPAYFKNIKDSEYQLIISEGFLKYYGFDLSPDKIYCEGCTSEKTDPILLEFNCPVRKCTTERGLGNCASCDDYYCSKLKGRADGYLYALSKFNGEIPHEDYNVFFKPYEGKMNLEILKQRNPVEKE